MAHTLKISKTSKQNIKRLTDILDDILAVESFIKADNTHVCRKSHGLASNEHICENHEVFGLPKSIISINKLAGSDLCYLYNARAKLQNFIKLATN